VPTGPPTPLPDSECPGKARIRVSGEKNCRVMANSRARCSLNLVLPISAVVLVLFQFSINILVLRAEDTRNLVEKSPALVHSVEYADFWTFLKNHPVVLMQFYSPLCDKCKDFAPKFEEAASQLIALHLGQPEIIFANYDDSTPSQRQLRAGAKDGKFILRYLLPLILINFVMGL
jgi:thiol-disulfide isomerase/thioredoxin